MEEEDRSSRRGVISCCSSSRKCKRSAASLVPAVAAAPADTIAAASTPELGAATVAMAAGGTDSDNGLNCRGVVAVDDMARAVCGAAGERMSCISQPLQHGIHGLPRFSSLVSLSLFSIKKRKLNCRFDFEVRRKCAVGTVT